MKLSKQPQTYLGDGVYARFDGYHVWIWTSDGYNKSVEIALEPAVIAEINAFADKCRRGKGKTDTA